MFELPFIAPKLSFEQRKIEIIVLLQTQFDYLTQYQISPMFIA